MRCDGVGVGLVAALDAATASSVDDALDPELLRAWAGTSSASDATREQLGDRNELARYIVRGRDGVSIEKQAEVLRMELGEALEAWRAGRSAAAKKRVKQAASTARRWGTIQGYDGLVDAAAAAMREVDPRLMLKAQIRRSAGFKEVVQQFWDIMRVESTLTRVHMEGEGGGGFEQERGERKNEGGEGGEGVEREGQTEAEFEGEDHKVEPEPEPELELELDLEPEPELEPQPEPEGSVQSQAGDEQVLETFAGRQNRGVARRHWATAGARLVTETTTRVTFVGYKELHLRIDKVLPPPPPLRLDGVGSGPSHRLCAAPRAR
jgi:hypothetical protein